MKAFFELSLVCKESNGVIADEEIDLEEEEQKQNERNEDSQSLLYDSLLVRALVKGIRQSK